MLRRPIEPAQYMSFKYSERLEEAGVDMSVGSVGDAYDNTLAESTIGLFKTEVIERIGPWKSLERQVRVEGAVERVLDADADPLIHRVPNP